MPVPKKMNRKILIFKLDDYKKFPVGNVFCYNADVSSPTVFPGSSVGRAAGC